VAAFTPTCTSSSLTCTFDATASTDPDGVVRSYSWSFGDATTAQDTTGLDSHVYAANGAYPVTLTVTDNDGGTGSVTHIVDIGVAPPGAIAFSGASTNYANAASDTVTIPASALTGDGLLLFDTYASSTVTATPPAGWTLVGSSVKGSQTTAVYQRVADSTDAGTPLTVTYSAAVKASLTIADYTGTSQLAPVEAFASATAAGASSDTAPALSGLSDGSVVVSFWADKSSATTSISPPAAVTSRSLVLGVGVSTVNALLGDSGGAVSGSYGAQTATTNDASIDSASWTIALAQAGS
jgi:hypothetical protein